jgi:hypothetical protein
MDTLGKGAFCKVKAANAKIVRQLKKRNSEEMVDVTGIQEMAVKVFNRKQL